MRKLAIGLCIVVAVVIIGAGVFLAMFDIEDHRARIVAEASKALGRRVALDGSIRLDLSLHPTLRLRRLRIANVEGGSAPEMIRLARLEARIDLMASLGGNVVIERIALEGLDVLLEQFDGGRNNFTFPTSTASGGDPAGAPPVPLAALVENAKIVYRVGNASHEVNVTRLAARGESDGRTLWITLAATAAGSEISLDGTLADIPAAPRLVAALTAKAATIEMLAALAGIAAPKGMAMSLAARLDGSMEAMKVEDLRLTLGETRLAGRLEVRPKGPVIRAALAGERLDLRRWQGLPGEPAEKAGSKKNKLFPAEPLPLVDLGTLDAEVALKLATLVTSSLSLRTVEARLTAKEGRLSLDPLGAVLAGGRIDGSVALDARGERPAMSLRLKGSGIDFGELAEAVGAGDMLSAKGSIDLDFKASGGSIAEIAANIDGESKVLLGKGRIDAKALDLAVGGLTTVLGSMFQKDSEGSVLNCAASRIVFAKGVGTHKLLLVDTGASTVTGEGLIDLANERLEMKITPRPKSVTLNVAVPIKIGGSLASPSVAPDGLATLAKIGGLLGAVFFPPAALLAFADIGGGDEVACLKGVAGSR